MGAFQQLFKSIQTKQSGLVLTEPIPAGQPFPAVFEGGKCEINLALFLSLTCRECVYLLSDLPPFLTSYSGGIRMYMKGREEEVRQLIEYYEFEFPVSAIKEEKMTGVYRIPSTPYLYAVNGEGDVVGSGNVHNVEELKELISSYFHL